MKNMGIFATIGIFLIGIFIAFGKIQAQSELNQTRTEKLEEKTEEVKEDVEENSKIDIEQTVTLKYIQQTLQALNKKLDKETEEEK